MHGDVCKVKDELKLHLDVKDLGNLRSCLGVMFFVVQMERGYPNGTMSIKFSNDLGCNRARQ